MNCIDHSGLNSLLIIYGNQSRRRDSLNINHGEGNSNAPHVSHTRSHVNFQIKKESLESKGMIEINRDGKTDNETSIKKRISNIIVVYIIVYFLRK